MEGSVTLWLPDVWPLQKHRHPWGRTYREGKLARWEYDESYCDAVKKTSPYDSGPRLLDIIDTAVFDYLIGNADRHHYESFQDDEGASMLILLDNAKSFGNPSLDERSILAPLYQCCIIRVSTWNRLNSLKNGVLKSALKSAMAHDPISPVLSDPHLDAVEQRLLSVLATVKQCTDQFGMDTVLVEDRMPLALVVLHKISETAFYKDRETAQSIPDGMRWIGNGQQRVLVIGDRVALDFFGVCCGRS